MPLLPTIENRTRKHAKTMLVLRHLRQTIYSTADLLGQLMQIKDRSNIFTSLRAMEQERLITHQSFKELGGIITLWVITATGQHRATNHGEEPNLSVFNPSKISIANLLHYLDIQRAHIRAHHSNWTSFQYVDRYRRQHLFENQSRASKIRPDLIAINPQGNTAALEIERIRKAEKRYKTEIIPGHIRNLNANEYEFIVWITDTPQHQKELHDLFQTIVRELRSEQKWFLEVPSRPFKPFQFANMESWPNY
jgi:hypothetical protein